MDNPIQSSSTTIDNPLKKCTFLFYSPPSSRPKSDPEQELDQITERIKNGPEVLQADMGYLALKGRNRSFMFSDQLAVTARSGNNVSDIQFHPEYPFLKPFKIKNPLKFRKESYCMLFYMLDLYAISFSIQLSALKYYVYKCYYIEHRFRYLSAFLHMFKSLEEWESELDDLQGRYGVSAWALVTFWREFSTLHLDVAKGKAEGDEQGDGEQKQVDDGEEEEKKQKGIVNWVRFGDEDFCKLFNQNEQEYKEFILYMCNLNDIDPTIANGIVSNLPIRVIDFPQAYIENVQDAFEHLAMKLLESGWGSSDSGRESDEYKNSDSDEEW